MTVIETSTSADTVAQVRAAYDTGRTRPISWRVDTLRRLRRLIDERQDEFLRALAADFGKPRIEAWATEVGFTLADIDHTLANLSSWMRTERVATPLLFQPSSSHVVREPVGVVGVIAPWNYPIQLLLLPVVAAIAAGNAVIAKPSEVTVHADAVLVRLLRDLNDPAVAVVQGGVDETTELLREKFDHIFYTGNGHVGRIVMRAAAEHLTPVTLELGGKSPAIVSRNANIDVAAKRIVWGKFLNAGQTCIAPDYVLVEAAVHDQLVTAMTAAVRSFYGTDTQATPDFARIVNDNHFARLAKLLGSGTMACGGQTDPSTRYIAPTILTDVAADSPVMQEEIFGPILPVLKVASLAEAVSFVNERDRPLALYSFSEDDTDNDAVVAGATSGGACVNGTMLHVSNPNLPFGGTGASGMGAYHGRAGFETFTHRRAVFTRSTKLDPDFVYPPYTAAKERLVRRGLLLPDPRDLGARAVSALRAKLGR